MSNCIIDNLENYNSLSDGAKPIARYDISKKSSDKNWADLGQMAVDCGATTSKEFFEYLRPFEEEILALREKNGEKVKTKAGKWLYTKVSQNSTYRTNKSVIGKALDNGVAIADADGKLIGKTATEKAYKIVTTKVSTPYGKAAKYTGYLQNLWPELDATQRAGIKGVIASLDD